MSSRGVQDSRFPNASQRRRRVVRIRLAAVGSLAAVAAVFAVIVFSSMAGSGSHPPNPSLQRSPGSAVGRPGVSSGTGKSATTAVPILAYHVINVPPPQSSASPRLYVPAVDFSMQMAALRAAGWHAVTLDQLRAHWTRGASLGPDKPIVITFDTGYASQSTNALPVLKRIGWVGVENLRVSGLPASEGGLTDVQIRGLVAAGWELDTQGLSQPDLTVLSPGQLRSEIAVARQELRSRYGVPVNWFCYPSGRYDATVVAAVRAAGFVGASTVIPGWVGAAGDRFRLPRLDVVGGTSPSALLSQIASAEGDAPPPPADRGSPTA